MIYPMSGTQVNSKVTTLIFFNDTATSKLYTDIGLFTANEEIGTDVSDIFTQLTGLGRASRLKHLWQAPFTLHKQILRAIHNEIQHAQSGGKGRIIAKMNALLEPETIAA